MALGQNCLQQAVLFNQPPLVRLLNQPAKILEEEEGGAAICPWHSDRPISRDRQCQGGFQGPTSTPWGAGTLNSGKNRKAKALTSDTSELLGVGSNLPTGSFLTHRLLFALKPLPGWPSTCLINYQTPAHYREPCSALPTAASSVTCNCLMPCCPLSLI